MVILSVEGKRDKVINKTDIQQISGAIFDLDGTLLDSMFVWDELSVRFLEKRGLIPPADLKERFKALTLREAAEYYTACCGVTGTIERVMEEINREVESYYFYHVIPKPGVNEFLKKLYTADIPMCIVTATDRYQVEAALRRCGLDLYFQKIFTCSEVGCGKDRPDIFYCALDFLKAAPDKTVVFDDAIYALRTANKAGFCTVGVYDDCTEKSDWEKIKQECCGYIESFTELL